MDREEQVAVADAAPVEAAAEPTAQPEMQQGRDAGGPVPAVQQEPGREAQKQTASEQAYEGEKEKQAARDTQRVLEYIRTQAKRKAKEPMNLEKDSMFYKRMSEHYLKDAAANPGPETGKAAMNSIGEQLDPSKADPNDYWERNAGAWNEHKVPPGLKLLLPDAPETMGAGTAVMSQANRKELPYIDAPQLIGKPNTDVGEDADVYGGGKNISQLMHWATGVKYGDTDPQTMRDLFLAYEYYHLEGWDKFGEDAINDMIGEDAGRIMGRQLMGGEINNDNMQLKLNDGFNESRAWVGSLIKARQGELDAMITSKTVVESAMWYGKLGTVQWWGDSTIYLDLLRGKSIEEVQQDSRVAHFIDIYSLSYYSEQWQKEQHQKIEHSNFTKSMLKGKYDKVFEKSVKEEPLTDKEKVDAYLDAKAPWVPGFLRPIVKGMAGKRLKGDKQDDNQDQKQDEKQDERQHEQ